jgi:predicted HAD superfamily Cof-like phosphohydrolase
MNKSIQDKSAEFMTMAGQEVRKSPYLNSEPKEKQLRVLLLLEEVLELAEASGVNLTVKGDKIDSENFKDIIDFSVDEKIDIVQVCDAIADIGYVLYGACNTYGIDFDKAFDECHESNMTKFIDGHRDESTGKWIKGPSYKPADFGKCVTEMYK